jgi:hypothetical protein
LELLEIRHSHARQTVREAWETEEEFFLLPVRSCTDCGTVLVILERLSDQCADLFFVAAATI